MHILNRLVAIVALFVMVVPAAVLLLFPDSYGMPFIQLILLCGVSGIVTARQQLWHKPGRWFVLPILAAVVAIPFAVILRVFGSFDVLSLVFHAQFGVEGTTLAGFEDEILEGAAAVLGITFAGYALANLINRRTAGYVLTALVLVLVNPIVRYGKTAQTCPET